jgi:hypothetical protein
MRFYQVNGASADLLGTFLTLKKKAGTGPAISRGEGILWSGVAKMSSLPRRETRSTR